MRDQKAIGPSRRRAGYRSISTPGRAEDIARSIPDERRKASVLADVAERWRVPTPTAAKGLPSQSATST